MTVNINLPTPGADSGLWGAELNDALTALGGGINEILATIAGGIVVYGANGWPGNLPTTPAIYVASATGIAGPAAAAVGSVFIYKTA